MGKNRGFALLMAALVLLLLLGLVLLVLGAVTYTGFDLPFGGPPASL